MDKIGGKQIITVLNKSDLPAKLDTVKLPQTLANTVKISAKEGTGIENLNEKIIETLEATDFDLRESACFTSRQEDILKKLTNTKSKQQIASIITELLNGQLSV